MAMGVSLTERAAARIKELIAAESQSSRRRLLGLAV